LNLVFKISDIGAITALQVTPQTRIPLPKATFDINTPQIKQARYDLQGIAFTELKWAEKRRQVEDGGLDTRDLGLLLIMQQIEGGESGDVNERTSREFFSGILIAYIPRRQAIYLSETTHFERSSLDAV
jgi:hypothetical protein